MRPCPSLLSRAALLVICAGRHRVRAQEGHPHGLGLRVQGLIDLGLGAHVDPDPDQGVGSVGWFGCGLDPSGRWCQNKLLSWEGSTTVVHTVVWRNSVV